jgi:hypothetical protein
MQLSKRTIERTYPGRPPRQPLDNDQRLQQFRAKLPEQQRFNAYFTNRLRNHQ